MNLAEDVSDSAATALAAGGQGVEVPTRQVGIPTVIAGSASPLFVRQVRSRTAGVKRGSGFPVFPREQHQDRIRSELSRSGAVVVLGDALSGKTHLAIEAVRDLYGDKFFMPPGDGQPLTQLLDQAAAVGDAVVWLDDLQRYLSAESPSMAALRRAIALGVVVVATLRASDYDDFRPGITRLPQWDFIEAMSSVWVDPDDTERLAMSRFATEQGLSSDLAEAVRVWGLGKVIGGSLVSLDRLNAAVTQLPAGFALLRAVHDWRRLGIGPVHRDVARALASVYGGKGIKNYSDRQMAEAFDWAVSEDDGVVPLLTVEGDHLILSAMVAEQLMSWSSWPPPKEIWEEARRRSTAADKLTLGFVAHNAGQRISAEGFWEESARLADEGISWKASLALSASLRSRGLTDKADAALREARWRHDPLARTGVVPVFRGEQALDSDRLDRAFWQDAAGSADEVVSAAGDWQMGLILQEADHRDEAEVKFRQAAAVGGPAVGPQAMLSLGLLLRGSGRDAAALKALELLVSTAPLDIAAKAGLYAGTMLMTTVPERSDAYTPSHLGRRRRAEDLLKGSANLGDSEASGMAAIKLSRHYERLGDVNQAHAWLWGAMSSESARVRKVVESEMVRIARKRRRSSEL